MPRKVLRRLLHNVQGQVREGNLRAVFGELLNNPNVWHLNRYSVSTGVSVGLFMAFAPVPAQMILAAAAAIMLGCNLPIAVAMVWVSNPVTMGPLFFAAYKLGAWLLGVETQVIHFEMKMDWLLSGLGTVWEPFLLGCAVLGLSAGLVGNLTVRVIWRIHVMTSWRERRRRRLSGEVTFRGGELTVERSHEAAGKGSRPS
jgi:uncharacterized protein (DUF2062 family)